jgi:hypothetical protein
VTNNSGIKKHWFEKYPKYSRRYLFFSYCQRNAYLCAAVVIFVIGVVALGVSDFDDSLNPLYWILGSVLILVLAVSLSFYVIYYLFWFRWYEHSGGRLIMQLIAAFEILVLLTVLRNLMILGGFIDSPYGTLSWWPLLRFSIYAVLSYTVINIDITLVGRFRNAQRLEFSVEPRRPKVDPTAVIEENTFVQNTELPPHLENTFVPSRRTSKKRKR